MHYQRKETAPQQSESRQDTTHHKTETSREQPVTSAVKKKSVTFGGLLCRGREKVWKACSNNRRSDICCEN
jgi:hypothetical protein